MQPTELDAEHLMDTITPTSLSHERSDGAHVALECVVRPFSRRDLRAVLSLARVGVLPDYIGVDFGDLGRIARCYQKGPRSQFWVAEVRGEIVGMVALAEVSRDVGELRWLRVAQPWQEGLHPARKLLRMAATFAREKGLLKLTIHAPKHVQPLVADFFHSLGFEYSRNACRLGRDTMEFYVNLYQRAELGSHPAKERP